MFDQHLSADDMPLFTRLRMTAFGEAVIDIANDPTFDEWTFSQKVRHALERETAARGERCLDDASESACVEIGKHACKHRVARGLVSAR